MAEVIKTKNKESCDAVAVQPVKKSSEVFDEVVDIGSKILVLLGLTGLIGRVYSNRNDLEGYFKKLGCGVSVTADCFGLVSKKTTTVQSVPGSAPREQPVTKVSSAKSDASE